MKFEFLFEDVLSDMAMDEARVASDVKFDAFAKSAGAEIAAVCDQTINRIMYMPGLQNFKQYISDQRDVDVTDPVSIILNVERFYESWINQLDPKLSNKIYKQTKDWLKSYKEKGKVGRPAGIGNKPKDNANKAMQGLDYAPTQEPMAATEPEVTTDPETVVEPEVPMEPKRGRGRPALPAELKKKYIPTGAPKGGVRIGSASMQDLIGQMRDMQAQIEMLKSQLKNRQDQFSNDEEESTDTGKIYESLELLKTQYKRFL